MSLRWDSKRNMLVVVRDNKGEKKMKRWYTTTSPNAARHILLATEKEAIEEARKKTLADGQVRYVVKIMHKVEEEKHPVKVTVLTDDEE